MANLWLPYRGEFGHKIMWHAPSVYADKSDKIMCCEIGEEALYPGAKEYIYVDRADDKKRRERVYGGEKEWLDDFVKSNKFDGHNLIYPSRNRPKEYFVPKNKTERGIKCDVVVCPRKRAYGNMKNWKLWPNFVKKLIGLGYSVFAAGAPDSSYDVNCQKAWDHKRFLDASIEAMLSSKVCIATDNGLAHLAVMCGRDLLMITDGGKTSPSYPGVCIDRFNRENHMNCSIKLIDCWNNFDNLIGEINV